MGTIYLAGLRSFYSPFVLPFTCIWLYLLCGIQAIVGSYGSVGMLLYIAVVCPFCAWICFYLSGFSPRIRLMIGSFWLKAFLKLHLR